MKAALAIASRLFIGAWIVFLLVILAWHEAGAMGWL